MKAYGYDNYYKIPSVIVVSGRADHENRNRQNEEPAKKKHSDGFETLFQEACRKSV